MGEVGEVFFGYSDFIHNVFGQILYFFHPWVSFWGNIPKMTPNGEKASYGKIVKFRIRV